MASVTVTLLHADQLYSASNSEIWEYSPGSYIDLGSFIRSSVVGLSAFLGFLTNPEDEYLSPV